MKVLDFLKKKPDQVSGFPKEIEDPYELFLYKLQDEYQDLLEEAIGPETSARMDKKRKWSEVVNDRSVNNASAQHFSFGFDDVEEEKQP